MMYMYKGVGFLFGIFFFAGVANMAFGNNMKTGIGIFITGFIILIPIGALSFYMKKKSAEAQPVDTSVVPPPAVTQQIGSNGEMPIYTYSTQPAQQVDDSVPIPPDPYQPFEQPPQYDQPTQPIITYPVAVNPTAQPPPQPWDSGGMATPQYAQQPPQQPAKFGLTQPTYIDPVYDITPAQPPPSYDEVKASAYQE